MATIYTLTIDPAALGITKPVDSVYIKNLYVDTDDTHIITAPFEYGAAVIGETTFAELPPTTLGSIYQIQLFGIEGMALSVFFGMPEHNSLLSELPIYTAYPPRSYYPEAAVAWGQLKGLIVDQTDLTDIMFTKDSAGALQESIDAKNTLQDTAIASKADATDMTSALALKANITDVNAKNALQDTAITDLQGKDVAQDTAIASKANTADVNAKNVLQDSAINNNIAAISAIQAYAPQDRTIAVTGDATWSVVFDGSKNVSGSMIVNPASTTQSGIVQLNNTISSTSTIQAATANAVRLANDLAAAAIPITQKGAINGVASLGADGKVTPSQLPTTTASAWGNITGNIANQTDLSTTYSKKADLGTAANKDIGTAVGQIPLAEQSFKAAFSYMGGIKSSGYSADDVMRGETMLLQDVLVPELAAVAPSEGYFFVEERALYNDHQQGLQTATGYETGCQFTRVRGYNGTFQTPWQPIATNPATYATTTASGANVAVDATGKLMRSTSSERYKDILAPLVLDDAKYADAMALKPIVYRSTADADNPLHHYYSFSAEELGAYDPAFTLWRYTEQVTDADGNTTEQPLAVRQAEGININALLAMSHAIAIKQDQMIKLLSERVVSLEIKQST